MKSYLVKQDGTLHEFDDSALQPKVMWKQQIGSYRLYWNGYLSDEQIEAIWQQVAKLNAHEHEPVIKLAAPLNNLRPQDILYDETDVEPLRQRIAELETQLAAIHQRMNERIANDDPKANEYSGVDVPELLRWIVNGSA